MMKDSKGISIQHGGFMEHKLPELPYAKDALAPHMSAETLTYHHDKHHKAYVTKLNELIKGTKFEYMPLEEIILTADGPLFNNAAQAWNHNFFWQCLAPNASVIPSGKVAELINKKWVSFDKFKAEFSHSALENFGSGWTWLGLNKKEELEILNTSNADTAKKHQLKAVLGVDVWEHAYYIDYRNERKDYLEGFWNLANWDFANKNLDRS
jgi:Fe-Mn family superoxide dismutase